MGTNELVIGVLWLAIHSILRFMWVELAEHIAIEKKEKKNQGNNP